MRSKTLWLAMALANFCVSVHAQPLPIDHKANDQAKNLYKNLLQFAGQGILFGHQNTFLAGYHWVDQGPVNGRSRSDVMDVAGSYPAVYGWDIAEMLAYNLTDQERAQRKNRLLNWSREGYERGGLLTYSWHAFNPATKQSFYDTTRAVHTLLPGGSQHELFKQQLDYLAAFFHELSPTPAIFRPWHEHNGNWFWWGKGLCTEEDFIDLWRFTVTYLKDERKVNNVLYAFSPDRSRTNIETFKTDYLYGYPGDEYVDILGLDNYWDLGHPANKASKEVQLEQFRISLENTVELADEKNKIAALTETGYEAIPDSVFWTDKMLRTFLSNEKTRRITYFMVWRNANFKQEKRDHYYAPYPGQTSAKDFVAFREDEFVYFEDEVPDFYHKNFTEARLKSYSGDDDKIGLMGRHQKHEDGSVSFAASGAEFTFLIHGTSLEATLKDEFRNGDSYNWFQVVVDGKPSHRFRTIPGRSNYVLARNLTKANHNIVLRKITEGQNGTNALVKIKTDSLLQFKEIKKRKIEFIGDSITCGFGADSTYVKCGDGMWFDQHDASASYAVRLAEKLQSQWMLSAVSGIGMFRNWNSDAPVMPDIYSGVYMDYSDSTSRWDFKRYQPDLVIIALGTNDFSDGGGPQPRVTLDRQKFSQSYKSFFTQLSNRYPTAKFLLLSSPMLSKDRNDALMEYLEEVSRGYDATKIFHYRYKNTYASGCSYHPSAEDHARMVQELEPVVKKIMGW